ncbi:hypothetical protein [Parapedobacter sp. DT-150]|uniref:hypothetical protein n=1 Tax=Parapedobacter sp. DT-150 TaxID=3396162 RepID=UPI003F1D9E78
MYIKHITISLLLTAILTGVQAQTTIHGSYKAVTIAMDQNVAYSKTLILLHEIYNGTLLPNNYVVGTIMALRGGTSALQRMNVVHINSGSAYNDITASISSVDHSATGWKLKTCLYNGKRYMALDVPYQSQQHSQGYHFVGWVSSSGENLKTVTYEINGEPQNQTLLSNIEDYDASMVERHQVSQFIISGKVGIGTSYPQADLAVNGNILAKEVKVKSDISVPDYVFDPGYQLPTLDEIEIYVKEHKHLPEVPSAADIEKDGLDLAEMNMLMLKKVEELTLHIINQDQRIKQLEKQNAPID